MELTQANVNLGIDYMQPFTTANGRSIQLVEIESGTNIIKVRFTEISGSSNLTMTNAIMLELVENYFKREYPDCAEVVQVL